MKDVFKSMLWGVTLLALILVGLFSLMMAVLSPSGIYISDQKLAANSKLASEVLPPLDYLAQAYIGTTDSNRYMLSSRPEIKKAQDFVEAKINGCNETRECTYIFSLGLFEYSRISDVRSQIQRVSNPSSVESRNQSLIFSCAFAALTFVLSIYAIFALIRYKRLSAIGESLFFAMLAPLLGLSLSLMFVNEYKNLENYYRINDSAMSFALFFIISPFLFYPPAIITARKRGIKIKDVLTLKGTEK